MYEITSNIKVKVLVKPVYDWFKGPFEGYAGLYKYGLDVIEASGDICFATSPSGYVDKSGKVVFAGAEFGLSTWYTISSSESLITLPDTKSISYSQIEEYEKRGEVKGQVKSTRSKRYSFTSKFGEQVTVSEGEIAYEYDLLGNVLHHSRWKPDQEADKMRLRLEETFTYARFNGANVDLGHFVGGNKNSPVPFIKKHFAGDMEPYGIYLDDHIATRNSEYVVAFGACTGAAEYTDFAVGQVFVKQTGRLTISASGNAFVMVDIFDEAEVEVTATDNAKICVNQYGGSVATITDDGAGNVVIKVICKQSKTY